MRWSVQTAIGFMLLACSGCSGHRDPALNANESSGSVLQHVATKQDELIVLAASSLKRPVDAVASELESSEASLKVRISYAGSQDLAAQVLSGAPADVFLSAGEKYMNMLTAKGAVEDAEVFPFAQNRLAIAFRGDIYPPLKVYTDLTRPGLRIVVGAKEVPIGGATQRLLDSFGKLSIWDQRKFDANVKSYESSDKAIVAKLRLGEADAAIVYESDLNDEPSLRSISIPAEMNVTMTYFAAVVKSSRNGAGKRFVLALLNPEIGGKAIEKSGMETTKGGWRGPTPGRG